jgi:hypothetical protein
MSSDDNALGSALWLGLGGVAGYAAGRWIVAPMRSASATGRIGAAAPRASSSGSLAATLSAPTRATRALIAGPSGEMRPIDPYGPSIGSFATTPTASAGPSGDMQPIAPYATPSQPSVTPPATTGPITSPSQLDAAASAALGAELATVLTSASPSSASRRPVLPSAPEPTGPITSPAQIATSAPISVAPPLDLESGPVKLMPSSSPVTIPSSRLPRRFDAIFDRYRGSIPIEYVRALVARESSFNPLARTGSAIGLMQIVPVVREDYNKRHGTPYQPEHLYDPSINVAVGCDLLRRIVNGYRKYHPRIANLQANWNNPRFVELLTLGWVAGYSEAGGVGRVARYLERLGAVDVTADQVSAHAKVAGATKHLSNPAKVAWSKSVVALYQRERALARTEQTFVSS